RVAGDPGAEAAQKYGADPSDRLDRASRCRQRRCGHRRWVRRLSPEAVLPPASAEGDPLAARSIQPAPRVVVQAEGAARDRLLLSEPCRPSGSQLENLGHNHGHNRLSSYEVSIGRGDWI